MLTVEIPDSQAKAAGQADVVKQVAVPDSKYGEGYWLVTLEIDEEKMPEGKELADTLAALVSNANGIKLLAGATEAKTVTIPAEAATSGLYYALLVSSDLSFVQSVETPRVLADGQNDLSLTVDPAADPAAPRFFKVKASLLKE